MIKNFTRLLGRVANTLDDLVAVAEQGSKALKATAVNAADDALLEMSSRTADEKKKIAEARKELAAI